MARAFPGAEHIKQLDESTFKLLPNGSSMNQAPQINGIYTAPEPMGASGIRKADTLEDREGNESPKRMKTQQDYSGMATLPLPVHGTREIMGLEGEETRSETEIRERGEEKGGEMEGVFSSLP